MLSNIRFGFQAYPVQGKSTTKLWLVFRYNLDKKAALQKIAIVFGHTDHKEVALKIRVEFRAY